MSEWNSDVFEENVDLFEEDKQGIAYMDARGRNG
jgi:hypothetical protein